MTDVSVIIRVKNEERWIGYCIQSVLDSFKNPEIIIVDNNSNDKSMEIVGNFQRDNLLPKTERSKNYANIKVFNIQKYSPGRAINLGVKNSKSPIVLVLSAHCVIQNIDFLKVKQSLKKNVCVFGNQVPIFLGKKIQKRYLWSHFSNKLVKNMFSKLENRHFIHNAFAFYQTQYLRKNKIDENLTGKEDRYYARQIISNKKSYCYDPDLLVEHHYTPNGKTWIGMA